MNDHSCWDENRGLWDSIVASYGARQDSICGKFGGKTIVFLNPVDSLAPHSSPGHAFDRCALPSKDGNSDINNKNPISLQRDIVAVLKSAPQKSSPTFDIPSQLVQTLQESCRQASLASVDLTVSTPATPTGWSLAEVANQKTLLLREDVLREVCDHAIHLDLGPLLSPVAAMVVLPSMSQACEPLSHPTIMSLCALATMDLEAYTTACFAPALKYSGSAHYPEVLARVIRQLNGSIWPHVHHLMKALSQRETVTEHHLVVVEAVSGIVPENPEKIAIESVASALEHVSARLSRSSSRVGRSMLAAVSVLAPHLHPHDPTFATVAQVVQAHDSPLKRAIQAQLKRVH